MAGRTWTWGPNLNLFKISEVAVSNSDRSQNSRAPLSSTELHWAPLSFQAWSLRNPMQGTRLSDAWRSARNKCWPEGEQFHLVPQFLSFFFPMVSLKNPILRRWTSPSLSSAKQLYIHVRQLGGTTCYVLDMLVSCWKGTLHLHQTQWDHHEARLYCTPILEVVFVECLSQYQK